MIREIDLPLVHVDQAKREGCEIKKTGAVIFIIDPETKKIAYGKQIFDNGRGRVNDLSINGESFETEDLDILTTAGRCMREELDVSNSQQVLITADISSHYLGSVLTQNGIFAHAIWAIGEESNFHPENRDPTSPEDDFELIGFMSFADLCNQDNLRPLMKDIFAVLIRSGFLQWMEQTDFQSIYRDNRLFNLCEL